MLTIEEFTPNTSSVVLMHASGEFSTALSTDGAKVTYEIIWPARVDWDQIKQEPVTVAVPRWTNADFQKWHPTLLQAMVSCIDAWFAEYPNRLINADLVRALLKLRTDLHNIWMEYQ